MLARQEADPVAEVIADAITEFSQADKIRIVAQFSVIW